MTYRVSQKITYRMLWRVELQCTGSITSSRHPLCLEINFFGRFLPRLSLIKPSQVMLMVKFSPTALNFGFDFVLLVHFWDTLYNLRFLSTWHLKCQRYKLGIGQQECVSIRIGFVFPHLHLSATNSTTLGLRTCFPFHFPLRPVLMSG